MSNARRVTLVAAITTVAVLSLGACAPAAHLPGHVTHPSGSASSASPTPTPTPTPVAVAPPVSRVPLTCDQLAPAAQVTSVMGLTLVPGPGLYQISDLDPYVFTQAGGIDCDYQTTHPDTDLGFYEVFVTPDVPSAEWTAYVPNISDYDIHPSPFGANSYLDCTATYHDADCDLQMMVGSTFVYINDYSPAQPTESNAASQAHFLPLLQTAVNAVKAATIAEPAWTDPNATTVSLPTSNDSVMSAVSTAVGFKVSTAISGLEEEPDPSQAQSLPQHAVDFRSYVGDSNKYEFTIDVLPMGSWAWAASVAAASSKPQYAVVTGLGDQAISYSNSEYNEPYQAVIETTKGDNLVSVDLFTSKSGQYVPMLATAKLATQAILAEIG